MGRLGWEGIRARDINVRTNSIIYAAKESSIIKNVTRRQVITNFTNKQLIKIRERLGIFEQPIADDELKPAKEETDW